MKEYEILDLVFNKKYNHPAIKWFTRKHVAQMDGAIFEEPKPAKNYKEAALRASENLEKGAGRAGSLVGELDHVAEIMAAKSEELFAKAGVGAKQGWEKIKTKPWAQKVMTKFGKKKQEGEVNDDFPEDGGVLAEAQEQLTKEEEENKNDKPLME
jgi:hypothetical protein